MATTLYPAFVYGKIGAYGVAFPDFRGFATAAGTLQEAAVVATEALTLHIGSMAKAGKPLPIPSPLDAPLPQWMAEEGEPASRMMVPVDLPMSG